MLSQQKHVKKGNFRVNCGRVIEERKRKGDVSLSKSVPLKHKLKRISSFRDDLNEIGIEKNNILLKKRD